MRPPECAVCGTRFDPADGALVTFPERETDRQWRERAAAERTVGHPPNVEWFCSLHAPGATPVSERLTEIAIAPTDIDVIRAQFADVMPAIVGDANALASTTSTRTWSPMDGAQPPYCPFVDVDVMTMTGPRATVTLTWDRAMWSDDAPARLTAQLWVTPRGADDYSVSATVGGGFEGSIGTSATRLLLLGALGAELEAVVSALVV